MTLENIAIVFWRIFGGVLIIEAITTLVFQAGTVYSMFIQLITNEAFDAWSIFVSILLMPTILAASGLAVIFLSPKLASLVLRGLPS